MSDTVATKVEDRGSANVGSIEGVAGAEAAETQDQTAYDAAVTDLAKLTTAVSDAQAVVTDLQNRIIAAGVHLTELNDLSNDGGTGTLDAAAALRDAEWNAYKATTTTEIDGVQVIDGESARVDDLVSTTTAAVKDQDMTTDASPVPIAESGGALTEAKIAAEGLWTTAKTTSGEKQTELTEALSGAVLETLRQTVNEDTIAWLAAQSNLDDAEGELKDAHETLDNAQKALDAAQLKCQIDAYDTYRQTLEDALKERADKLKEIKAAMEAELTRPDPGTEGARCEKALSNGTFRPGRFEGADDYVCGGPDSGLCCGAARVWMESGVTENAGWRTIETCQ